MSAPKNPPNQISPGDLSDAVGPVTPPSDFDDAGDSDEEDSFADDEEIDDTDD